jgi:hypothetical protein
MLVDVVDVQLRESYRLWLKFDDGVEGEVDIAALVDFDGVFEPLQAPEFFAAVRVEPALGTIVWPNGADLDSVVLHAAVLERRTPGAGA